MEIGTAAPSTLSYPINTYPDNTFTFPDNTFTFPDNTFTFPTSDPAVPNIPINTINIIPNTTFGYFKPAVVHPNDLEYAKKILELVKIFGARKTAAILGLKNPKKPKRFKVAKKKSLTSPGQKSV